MKGVRSMFCSAFTYECPVVSALFVRPSFHGVVFAPSSKTNELCLCRLTCELSNLLQWS